MPSVDDYLALITSYHRPRPRFSGTVAAVVEPVALATTLIETIPAAFDLDTAIGAQLDVVGQWVGRSRFVETPLPNLFFSFDDPPRGFDLGAWKGPYDSLTGVSRLDDDTYRRLLRAKIAANNWDGTVPSAQAALAQLFPETDGSKVFLEDKGDMSVVFGMVGLVPSLLVLALFSGGYLPLKPEGVKTYYVVTSVQEAPLFGFDVSNEYIAGFDEGAWGVEPSYYTDHQPI